MRNQSIAFRARARTIEHLGKGQIADCPTAVSELWKNSYDAYARDVVLHTFDGDYQCGVLADNGCGMTIEQLIRSWLVVGTESKSQKNVLPASDRFGLPIRKTQGEKGIGRLSAAFLAPTMFLVSKKIENTFCAAIVDWRMFENSYLSLEEISVPIAEFENIDSIVDVFDDLKEKLLLNFCSDKRIQKSDTVSRNKRDAWEKFGLDEKRTQNHTVGLTTEEKIKAFVNQAHFPRKLLNSWLPLLEKVSEIDADVHGTAIFLFDLERDLALLTNPGSTARDNVEISNIKRDLVDTLRAFANPFIERTNAFQYEIKTFSDQGDEKVILEQADNFNHDDFMQLEHLVQGEIDQDGVFYGDVRAFGRDLGPIRLTPNIALMGIESKVGPFQIQIGTFEIVAANSSLAPAVHSLLIAQAKKYSGLMIFRDGLRVLPYGRVDNDFFEMEEKRSLNAGRYYWSKRRIFGQILISQDANPLLRDKAGREGFIKNQAARELKGLISSILDDLADRFFGARSVERREILNIVKQEREARKAAQTLAKQVSQVSFVNEIKVQEPQLKSSIKALAKITNSLSSLQFSDEITLATLRSEILELDNARIKLKTPSRPPNLGDNEERYRKYRDMYEEFSDQVSSTRVLLNAKVATESLHTATDEVYSSFERNQRQLKEQLSGYLGVLRTRIAVLEAAWVQSMIKDEESYPTAAKDVVNSVSRGAELAFTMNTIDRLYSETADKLSIKYEPIIRALDRLANGVNLEYAFSMAEEEKLYFEEKAKNLQALAQLGISVEILAHEMEEADAIVTRGMNSLPKAIKNTAGFISAMNAHKALTHQIRFLSPLKLSGYQVRREITGQDIVDHIMNFFGDRFERQNVELVFGEKFIAMQIRDIPSRIFPVFTNLLNNSLYWVSLKKERKIIIDIRGEDVILANSGPPVDNDDIPRLFELFYSRRANGHGVGLYLCKENLAVARHTIKYNGGGDTQLIPTGANFSIHFNGMEIV